MKYVIPFLFVLSTNVLAVECPENFKGAKLTSWREGIMAKVLAGNAREAQSDLQTCFPTKLPACYSDLDYYIKEKNGQTSRSVGFAPENRTLKSVRDLPKEFVSPDGKVTIPANILQLAKQKSWPTVLYKTRGQGGFNGGENLFIMAIPGEKRDIFIQTSPHPDANDSTAKDPIPKPENGQIWNAQGSLTIITVDKTKNPPVGQLRLLHANGETNPMKYEWKDAPEVNDCYSCHTVPLRPISPVGYGNINHENRMTPQQIAQVDAMNRLLEQKVTWGKEKQGEFENRFGPPVDTHPLGWAPEGSRTRQEEFLRECATRNRTISNSARGGKYEFSSTLGTPPSINYTRLAEAMNCIECHDNKNRGVLSEEYDSTEVIFKVAVDRSMPRGVDLNKDERIALINCLDAEREALGQEWRTSGQWMKNESCFGDQFGGNPPPVVPSTNGNNNSNPGSSTTRQ